MTDRDLARQLVAYVDATTEPITGPSRRQHPSIPTTELIMMSPVDTEPPSRRSPIGWVALAAAAVIVVIVGFVITTGDSNEDPAPADQPQPTSTAGAPDSAVAADESSPDLSALAAVGDGLVGALASHDAAAAVELVNEEASLDFFAASDRESFETLFGWFDATGMRFEPDNCQAFETGVVSCFVFQSNLWSDAVDVDPVMSHLSLTIENGKVVRLDGEVDGEWGQLVFIPFADFTAANHPDDLDTMWLRDATGSIEGVRLSDRSVELFEQYTAEYVEAVSQQSP
jgi:hypothetical protein